MLNIEFIFLASIGIFGGPKNINRKGRKDTQRVWGSMHIYFLSFVFFLGASWPALWNAKPIPLGRSWRLNLKPV